MKTIAVIGAGISGLTAAHFLSRRHRVDLFEQERHLGGHTNTVLVDGQNRTVPLDAGTLVHNDRTYPALVRLFGELGVATRDSDMSFAVSCGRTGLEYRSRSLNGFFAQRRNLVRPTHLPLPREVVRLNRDAPALPEAPDAGGQTFPHRHVFPMASAIWPASLYVSPFMPVDPEDAFAQTPPAGRLVAHMEIRQAGAVGFEATLSLERRPRSAAEIRWVPVRYPAMTATVIAGIHRPALRLWRRGVPVVRRLTGNGAGERAASAAETAGRSDPVMER